MTRTSLARHLTISLSLCALAPHGAAQGAGGAGVNVSLMWPAPTAEDWARPVLVTFQRNWEDAVAVSRETGKPILICVNMDAEPASEHYAGIRYRDPETAALYEPYVCVVASVYRHTPRDYGPDGQPILCPRFGSVTCGEHIAIEPILYERYFDGRRVAPRHIMVELDGEEVYDVFFTWDTDSVFDLIKGGVASRPAPPIIARGDRSITERVASRDIADRVAVESAYRAGDAGLRHALLEAAGEHPEAAPVGLLRLALYSFDPELVEMARQVLANTRSESAVGLISEALRMPMDGDDREALVGALEEIGETSPKAKTLSVVHRGLSGRSSEVDVQSWSTALRGAVYQPASSWQTLETVEKKVAESTEKDASAELELAEASLEFALDPQTAGILAADPGSASSYSALQFQDALRAAQKAEGLGASGWRLDAVVAVAAFHLGDLEEAGKRAAAAVRAMPSGQTSRTSAEVLRLFAEGRQRAIAAAARERRDWPQEWLADAHAAYTILARHPLGTDAEVVNHHDLLRSLGAQGRAAEVLDEGLHRFPESFMLHDRLRAQILEDQGLEALEPTYEAMLAEADAGPNLEWYAGYTSIVAAEFHRRAGETDPAKAAYGRAIEHFERNIESNPTAKDSADHYIALALAGRARLAWELGEHETAVVDLLASLRLKPQAASSQDGLGFSPVTTAQTMIAGLGAREDLAASLQAALDQLDPAFLVPPDYEREVAPARGGRGRGGRRGRGRRGRGGLPE